jgi:hypothetical protein
LESREWEEHEILEWFSKFMSGMTYVEGDEVPAISEENR